MATEREWSRAYAKQALSDLAVLDVLAQSQAAACHYFHYLQMAAEKVCKAHLSQAGHEQLRKVHGYVEGTLPVIARNALAKNRSHSSGQAWQLSAIKAIAREIRLLAPACHADDSRPDNSEYPWAGPSGEVIVPAEHRFAGFTGKEKILVTVIKILRQAAEEDASDTE